MLYNVEIAQTFASENTIKTICFSRVCSILLNKQLFFLINGILSEFKPIKSHSRRNTSSKWYNEPEFNAVLERLNIKGINQTIVNLTV
jgi:hypothetical protein